MTGSSWIVGVSLASFASVLSNLGVNLQKKSHLQNPIVIDEDGKQLETPNYFEDRIWVLGLLCIIVGSFADFAALGFASQSIVAPLGSLTLVANVFFAPLLLGEVVSRSDIMATFVILCGAIIAVVFANHDETTYT